MAKAKKHILEFEQAYDFEMIGICSHHNDYRIAWGINEYLKIQLTKSDEDYLVVNKKGVKISQHSLYEYKDNENLIEYFLIKNKGQGKFLIPEKPSIDYFLFVYENYILDTEEIIEELRKVPSILGSYIFQPESIQSTENIVFN
jgi:hypothetical protein